MKRRMRKVFTSLLSLCLLLSLLPTMAFAEDQSNTGCIEETCSHVAAVGGTHYDTLAKAFAATSEQNNVVTLLRDVTDAQTEDIWVGYTGYSYTDVVLDLNGRNYTFENLPPLPIKPNCSA